MGRFTYQAVLDSGKRVEGILRSRDRIEALRSLLGRGYHPLSIRPAAEAVLSATGLKRRLLSHVGASEKAVFTRQLGALLKAGLPVISALATLRRQSRGKGLVRVIEDVEESLRREGGSLADALDEHPGIFNAVYRGIVRAGEEGGNLVEALDNLAAHLSRSVRLRGQVLGAFIYPIFIALLGAAAVFAIMTFVIPRFQVLFESFGQNLPLPTQLLIGASSFLSQWWWVVLISLAFLALIICTLLRKEKVRSIVDSRLLRLPVLGQMFLKLEISRISRTLGALLDSGVRILEALRVTGQTAKNRSIRQTFPMMIARVSSGTSLADAAEAAEQYPPLMISLIKTGEDTGELPSMLAELASIYEDEAERAVTGAVKLVEPLLIVTVGGIITAIVAAVMLPILQANTMIG